MNNLRKEDDNETMQKVLGYGVTGLSGIKSGYGSIC